MNALRIASEHVHHPRFVLVALVLMLLVALVVVPFVLRILEALVSYDLGPYEPKDRQRGERLERRDERAPAPYWDE